MKFHAFVALVLLGTVTITACEPRKGPLERAGERTDEIIDNARDGDPLLHKKGTAEKVGESIDDTLNGRN